MRREASWPGHHRLHPLSACSMLMIFYCASLSWSSSPPLSLAFIIPMVIVIIITALHPQLCIFVAPRNVRLHAVRVLFSILWFLLVCVFYCGAFCDGICSVFIAVCRCIFLLCSFFCVFLCVWVYVCFFGCVFYQLEAKRVANASFVP